MSPGKQGRIQDFSIGGRGGGGGGGVLLMNINEMYYCLLQYRYARLNTNHFGGGGGAEGGGLVHVLGR